MNNMGLAEMLRRESIEYGEQDSLCDTLYLAANAIESLQASVDFYVETLHEMDWVSVSDRLPEEGKSVLVYRASDNRVKPGTRIDVCPYLGEGIFCMTGVTHWARLPSPPKGAEK